jgi:hypothetical protein
VEKYRNKPLDDNSQIASPKIIYFYPYWGLIFWSLVLALPATLVQHTEFSTRIGWFLVVTSIQTLGFAHFYKFNTNSKRLADAGDVKLTYRHTRWPIHIFFAILVAWAIAIVNWLGDSQTLWNLSQFMINSFGKIFPVFDGYSQMRTRPETLVDPYQVSKIKALVIVYYPVAIAITVIFAARLMLTSNDRRISLVKGVFKKKNPIVTIIAFLFGLYLIFEAFYGWQELEAKASYGRTCMAHFACYGDDDLQIIASAFLRSCMILFAILPIMVVSALLSIVVRFFTR